MQQKNKTPSNFKILYIVPKPKPKTQVFDEYKILTNSFIPKFFEKKHDKFESSRPIWGQKITFIGQIIGMTFLTGRCIDSKSFYCFPNVNIFLCAIEIRVTTFTTFITRPNIAGITVSFVALFTNRYTVNTKYFAT